MLGDYMKDENVYYVYAHYKPNEDTPFYVGKGSGRRLQDTQHRSNWWINIVNKHGFVAKKLVDNLSHTAALLEEAKFIRLYGRLNLHTGCLINLTDGMDGNARLSKETKQKMSLAATGRKWSEEYKNMFSRIKREYFSTNINPMRGKTHSEHTRKKIGEKSKQKVFTDAYRLKLSNATSGTNNPRAKIYIIEGMKFFTRNEAEKYFGMCFATINKRYTIVSYSKKEWANMSENGKTDKPRPFSVPIKTYKSNYEHTFAKKEETVEREPLPQDILDKLTQLSQEIGEYESVLRETTGNDEDREDI